ncbi:SGNH/GDSL hydrolase family protein [Falsarthrobacter nasiphocae]|uniref:Lysophospholipase L1-like esterase n=1 Tax=Falsarthrobacter nasiphocae TaxID=189863 RepID=A0AAE4C774_9MICC|nr:SGNH/GDSL hydrolase family protein [Falsarthrobacter nasiphocae]MDR6892254.1 lysophospholipase L1-like esterase [Falsarthrobacter nasiphocae]
MKNPADRPHRYLALGDSFTEGVGDWDASRPNGVRGWADRVGEQLIATGEWSYANLAVRGKKAGQVLAEQLPEALRLKPTLVTCYAGGNDFLRPSVDLDAVVSAYVAGLARLVDAGCEVAVFTAFDSGASKTFTATRSRAALYNELLREGADREGFAVVDFWRMKEFQDWRYWDEDRLHLASLGHARMAENVLAALGKAEEVEVPDLGEAPRLRRLEAIEADLVWARKHFVPWVGRRVRGVSSGDGMKPKYPEFVADLTESA